MGNLARRSNLGGLMTARRIALTAAVLILVLALIWLAMYLNRGSTDSTAPYPTEPERVAQGKPAIYYQDLGTMTASSLLVFEGTVLSAHPGEVLRFREDEGGPETERNLEVRVDSVLYNPTGVALPDVVDVIEGWWSEGEGYAWEGMPWAQPQDRGYFYVTSSDRSGPAGPYSYVSDFGRVVMNQRGVRPSGAVHDGPWRSLGTNANEEAVAALIRAAVHDAQSGKAKPAPAPHQVREGGK